MKERLDFDSSRLPERACPAFDKWYAEINPARITLIFPAASLNNPASMYGHTLLRIDPPAHRGATTLASYALNFAAQTNESNGLMFAVKGLTGFYKGRFAILPYYDKVQSYGDIENRDIWEYDLNFTHAQTRMIMMHAWELDEVDFDYYFFDENCSYQLLSLLEAARPSLHLTDRFFYHAIPSDTVRVTVVSPGILGDINFRPSLRTRINWRADGMSDDELALALAITQAGFKKRAAELATYDPQAQARILDTAYDLRQYRYNRAGGDRAAHALVSLDLLRLRSQLAAGETVPSHHATGAAPHESHASARADFGIGSLDDTAFAELRIRPAYHDLLDPPTGFTEGAEINMFALALRGYESGSVQLESLEFVDILSLSPRSRLFKPLSWGVNRAGLGFLDRLISDKSHRCSGRLGARGDDDETTPTQPFAAVQGPGGAGRAAWRQNPGRVGLAV
ncbi:MAG: Lnb N-terminal periplasmic domain-containing protein [Gammaproteobacteria bacterium]